MNCRASLANVSRLRIQSWIYSLGGWRFERGKEHVPWIHFRIACKVQRRLSLFWNRIDHHLLRANVSHGIHRREILWIFQQTFTRNWISQTAKKETRKKYRAHDRVYFCFLSSIRVRDGSTFFGILTSKSKREEKQRCLPRRRDIGKANSGWK